MKIKIKRIDKSLPLPKYHTPGSVACDLYIREEVKIAARQVALLPANVIIEIPKGYMCMIASRSSTPLKKGLLMPNGIGVIDQDYCGPEDEFKVEVYNFTDKEVIVEKGERLGQLIFLPIELAEWEEIDEVKSPSRGGYGSTGTK